MGRRSRRVGAPRSRIIVAVSQEVEILEQLRAAPCRIAHERVLFDGPAAMRSRSRFVRVGLCPENDRLTQLACAHTIARYRLQDAATALAARGLMTKEHAAATVARITALADVVQFGDWAKGDLEAAYAVARETGDEDALATAAGEIETLERNHTAAAIELGEILEELRELSRRSAPQ